MQKRFRRSGFVDQQNEADQDQREQRQYYPDAVSIDRRQLQKFFPRGFSALQKYLALYGSASAANRWHIR